MVCVNHFVEYVVSATQMIRQMGMPWMEPRGATFPAGEKQNQFVRYRKEVSGTGKTSAKIKTELVC